MRRSIATQNPRRRSCLAVRRRADARQPVRRPGRRPDRGGPGKADRQPSRGWWLDLEPLGLGLRRQEGLGRRPPRLARLDHARGAGDADRLRAGRRGRTPPAGLNLTAGRWRISLHLTDCFSASVPTDVSGKRRWRRRLACLERFSIRGSLRAHLLHMTLLIVFEGLLTEELLRRYSAIGDRIGGRAFKITFDRVARFDSAEARRPLLLLPAASAPEFQFLRRHARAPCTNTTSRRCRIIDRRTRMSAWFMGEGDCDEPIEPISWTVGRLFLIQSLVGRSTHIVRASWPLLAGPPLDPRAGLCPQTSRIPASGRKARGGGRSHVQQLRLQFAAPSVGRDFRPAGAAIPLARRGAEPGAVGGDSAHRSGAGDPAVRGRRAARPVAMGVSAAAPEGRAGDQLPVREPTVDPWPLPRAGDPLPRVHRDQVPEDQVALHCGR